MPCTKCKDDKYKWGKTGSCEYDTKEECEKANPKNYNKMRPTPLGKSYEEYEKELKEFNLSKVEKVQLGAIDDLKKFNDEARKLIEVLSQGNTDVSEEYQLVKNKARDYNRLNKSYRDDVKKGKAAFKNLKGSISEVEKAVKELGLKPNDIPEFSSSSRALDVLRGFSMDAVNYPDIEI